MLGNIDMLCEDRIKSSLKGYASSLTVECRSEVTSTNNILKERAFDSECALIALSQTAGKGRLGRSFFSPHDTGLYLSLRLRFPQSAEKLMLLTPAAAVAACRAIEAVGGEKAQIKWVNDLILHDRKVCGILTEVLHSPDGELTVIVGVGINVYAPDEGFPDELRDIAGYVFSERRDNLRNDLASAFINCFAEFFCDIDNADFISEYRERSCIVGKRINVIKGGSSRAAQALDIDNECRLLIRYDDGTAEALYSGEISIRTV